MKTSKSMLSDLPIILYIRLSSEEAYQPDGSFRDESSLKFCSNASALFPLLPLLAFLLRSAFKSAAHFS